MKKRFVQGLRKLSEETLQALWVKGARGIGGRGRGGGTGGAAGGGSGVVSVPVPVAEEELTGSLRGAQALVAAENSREELNDLVGSLLEALIALPCGDEFAPEMLIVALDFFEGVGDEDLMLADREQLIDEILGRKGNGGRLATSSSGREGSINRSLLKQDGGES